MKKGKIYVRLLPGGFEGLRCLGMLVSIGSMLAVLYLKLEAAKHS